MSKITRSIKAGLKAFTEATTVAQYQGGGHHIRCLQCEGDRFKESAAMVGLGVFLTCDKCGMSQLYGKKPEKIEA
jgi:cytochrome c-type biogenesis protein CcmH/NrfF